MAPPDAIAGLKSLWSKFLGISPDGITDQDSLLSLGAKSDEGLKIYAALQEPPWEFKFYPSTPFMSWSLREHAHFLKGRFEKNIRDTLLKPKEYKNEEKIPLSFPQEQIWFQLQDSTSPLIYNYSHVLCFPGQINVSAMEASANLLVQRHRILDTTFHEESGKVFQRLKNYTQFSLPVQDLMDMTSSAPTRARLEQCQQYLARNLLTPFNLTTGPLYKWYIILVSPEMSILQGVVHHIVVDGTAAHITELELRASYAAFCKGRDPSAGILPPMQIQYMDFIAWQRSLDKSQTFEQFSDFWKKYLENLTPLDLPRDSPRISSVGATASSLRFKWQLDVSKFAKEMRVTSFVVLLSTLTLLLGRYTKQKDVSILTAKHGRTNSKLRTLLGHFINTIVVRTCITNNNISFKELVRQIDISLTNIYENQEYPFQHVVQDLIQESKNGNSFQYLIFPVCLVMLPKVVKPKNAAAELTNYLEVENNLLTHELTFYLEEGDANLSGFVKYNSAIHSAARIQQMVSNFETLLENCLAEPGKDIKCFEILKPAEIQSILKMGSGRQVSLLVDAAPSLVGLFEKQVLQTPSNTAVVEGALELTYSDLNKESDILRELFEMHLEENGSECFIAILLPQSANYIRASIAVLKVGKIVVPLSVQNSVEYLEKMLQNLGNPLLVTSTEVVNGLGFLYTRTFLLGKEKSGVATKKRVRTASAETQTVAYCIHTSGSTGFPKPVNISNASLINHSNWARTELQISETDKVLVFNNISFDASIQDIWPFLLTGATLCIPPLDLKYKVHQLWDYISAHGVTCLTLPTAIADKALSIFDNLALTSTPLRVLLVGGDYLHSWRPGLPFDVVNGYGLTECTIISTFASLNEKNFPSSGIPIWNTQIYILDEHLKFAPIGVSGEIYVSGAGVSSYWNRDDLNQQKFIDNPFVLGALGGLNNNVMYKTGDLGYWRFDGNLCVVGRLDDQVKVRGHRVELGEIEGVLVSYENVTEAVVILQAESASLSAFCRMSTQPPIFQEFQSFLKQRLPSYALPSQIFICSEDFPLTITGKIDRKALEEKHGMVLLCPEFIPVEDDVEVLVSNIWAEVLGLPVNAIGREDNFFGLGGHSLLVADVLCLLQEEPSLRNVVNLQVEDLFKEPTVAGFAKVIKTKLVENEQEVIPEIPLLTAKITTDEKIPLSFQQEQIWLHMQENSDCLALYNETFSIDFIGAFNEEAMKRAIQIILKRHNILRSNYHETDGGIYFKVNSKEEEHSFSIKTVNLLRLKIPQTYLELISQKVLHTAHRKPFNLSKDILIRFTYLSMTSSVSRVQVIFHHLIMDAIGIITFEKELRALYKSGNTIELSPLEFQYSDFALWQRQHFAVSNSSTKFEEAFNFWKEFLAGVEPVNLFPHKQRKFQKFSKESGSLGFNLTIELSEKVKEFCANRNTTPFVTLLSVLKILIYRYSNQSDICISCTTSGRNAARTRRSLDTLIGYFVNVVIFRNDLSGSPSFNELISRVHGNQNKVLEYQDYPFQNVVRDSGLKLGEDLYRLGVTMEPRNLRETSFFFEQVDYHTKYEFTVCFDESKTNYMLYLVFSRDVYIESEIEAFGGHFQALLEQAMEFPTESIDKLNILSKQENRLVLDIFNQKRHEIPIPGPEVTLIQLFQEQVHKTPDNVALVENGQELTYFQLNAEICKRSDYLQMSRFTRNDFVGLLLPQCTEFITNSFAILLAGKICVPLSVDHPRKQLDYMLKEVGNPVLVTTKAILETTGLTSYAEVILVEDWPHLLSSPLDVPERRSGISASAYCFFTSGSTGLPKAVIAEHSGIINVTLWFQQEYSVSSKDRTLLFVSPAFDGSLVELWPFLTSGATVFIPPNDIRYNVAQLHAWVLHHKLTFVFRTTRLSEAFFLIDFDPEQSCSIRWLFCGGEPLYAYPPPTLPYRVGFAYGSTETTILSTVNNLPPFGGKGVPTIGFPISNVRVYVLDSKSLMPMPIGVPGEIFVGGVGVTPGYLNKEELNRDKIISDPYAKTSGAKMYRSGDLGYWIPAGELVILGRQDSQVKIRGIRVGLGQVEEALMQYPRIDQAIVSVRSDNNTLAAYCVGVKPLLNELTDFLRKLLPVYAIPSVVLFVPEFPLTAVGKVDKKALTEKAESEFESCFQDQIRVPPVTSEELIVAQVWSEILKIPLDGINRDDNFFSLGGHSLLVGAVVTRFQDSPWFIELRIGDLFKDPTVRSFALIVKSKLGQNSVREVDTVSSDNIGMSKLSFQQEQIWLHMQEALSAGGDANLESLYNETFSLNFTESLDMTLFRRALQMVINRHSILRTNFVEVGGDVFQIVKHGEEQNIPILTVDVSHLKNSYTKDMISRRLLFASQKKPFNLRSGRLIRLRLIKLRGGAADVMYRLQVICHHLIIDAVGAVILERELKVFYEMLQGNFSSTELLLSPFEFQYSDFARRQRQVFNQEDDKSKNSKDFWKEYLNGLEAVTLFPKHKRVVSPGESPSGVTGFVVSPESTQNMKSYCKEQNTTPFVVLMAALKVLIYRYTNQDKIFTVCTTDGRNQPKLDALIGYFINNVIFRTDVSGHPSFTTLVNRVQQNNNLVMTYQDYPFQQIVADVDQSALKSGLYNLAVTMEPRNYRSLEHESTFYFERIEPVTKFDLLVCFDENGVNEGIQIGFLYNRNVYEDYLIQNFSKHFETLLEHLVSCPEESIDSFNFLSDEETRLTITDFNEKNRPFEFPKNISLAQLFLEQAENAMTAQNLAIYSADGRKITYAELKNDALGLTNLLQNIENEFVAILLPQSTEFVTATVGILLAGKVCVPLSIDHPVKSLEFMLHEVGNPILITTSKSLESTGLNYGADVLLLDKLESYPIVETKHVVYPTCAYCLFTSGSTGRSKPVLVEHSGIINCATWLQMDYEITSTDRSLLASCPAFDLSTAEIWPFLLSGATLCIPPEDFRYSIANLHAWVMEHKVTFAFLTTKLGAAFWQIPTVNNCSLKWLMTGGEALHNYPPTSLPYSVFYGYGTTETSNFTTLNKLISGQTGVPSNGSPIGNVRVYILDEHTHNHMPTGAVGEICIGGIGVSPGYLNRPEENERKFVPDPYSPSTGNMYKSGDLGYWLPTAPGDRELVVIGRKDNQVKVRGIRIGLGQIEEILEEYPNISQALVLVEETDQALSAFCIGNNSRKPHLQDLLTFLNSYLPRNAVPSSFTFVSSFPLNAIGKIDKCALLLKRGEPETEILKSDYIAPSTVEEKLVAQIWSDVLVIPLERISSEDNFFALGGHSLLLTECVQRLRVPPWNFQVSVSDLFGQSTLSKFAAKLAGSQKTTYRPHHIPKKLADLTSFPLSFPQEQILFHTQAQVNRSASLYTVAFQIEFTGHTVNLPALNRSINMVVSRHKILMSTIHESQGKLYQKTHPSGPPFILANHRCLDLRKIRLRRIQNFIAKTIFREHHLKASFNLQKGPLVRLTLVRFSTSRVLVFGSCHHCVMDGLSVKVFENDVRRIYNGIRTSRVENEYFEPLEIQYSDYVLWQRESFGSTGLSEEAFNFWKGYLDGLSALELRTEKPRSQNDRKYKSAAFKFEISSELSSLVSDFSKSHKVTSFVTLLSVLKVLLFRYTKQSDIFLVSTTDGRSHPDFQNLIGHFINMILLRTTGLHGKLTFEEVLESVHESITKVYKHQDSPLQNVVSQMGVNTSEVGLYRFCVTMTTTTMDQDQEYFDEVIEFDSMYELFFSINETPNKFQFLIWYDIDLYTNQRMEHFASHFNILLDQTMGQIGDLTPPTIGALNLLSDAERSLVLYTFNDTKVETQYPINATISELFEQQVRKTPENIAIMAADGVQITYSSLNQKAECYKTLIQCFPEEFAVILLPQSIEFIATTIATLKCGKICVPVNVDSLNAAILNILREVGNPVLITKTDIIKSKELVYSRIICLDTDNNVTPDKEIMYSKISSIAYCLGTSGSTGSPKLTMLAHDGLINLMSWLHSVLELSSADRSLLFTSPAFDLSQNEIWGYLFCGGTLCIPPKELRYDVKGLKVWVNENKVTVLNMTTRVAEKFLLLDTEPDTNTSVRILQLGGETFNSSIPIPESLPYKVINSYGVMEASVMSTFTYLTPNSSKTSVFDGPVIGKPISNVQVYILSEDGNISPLPVGVTGEICIGGIGVSPGYLNRPELNKQKFIPNTFSSGKLYKTEDLGYWLPSGDLVIVGRRDDQIKIRGLRTNLGNIERSLLQYPGIVQAVVLMETSPKEVLTAYFVSTELPSLNQIRDFLRKLLPQFAIPTLFYIVSYIPLNSVGKVDKSKLMAMKSTGYECKLLETNVNPPRHDDETLVAHVWSEVLQISTELINVEDNFFSLGGHSLLAVEIIHKLRVDPWNYDVKIADVFACPMLSDFAALLPSRRISKESTIEHRVGNSEYFPLSFAQEQVWMHLQDNQHSALYNIGFSLDFSGHLVDMNALRHSVLVMVERHEIFRVTIHEIHGSPRQKIHKMDQFKYLPIEHDLQDLDAYRSIAAEIFKTPFDLATGPLIKFHVLKISPEIAKLLVFSHHCLMDGTSIQIFVKELNECYNSARLSGVYNLTALPIQYMDYVLWQKELGIRSESMNFWKDYLSDLVPLEFQTDCPRHATELTKAGSVNFTISSELAQLIKNFSKLQKTTNFATLFSIFAVLIYRYTNQSDYFVVSPDSGRSHSETQNLIGHFINLLVIRVRNLSKEISFVEVVRSVHDSISQVYLHSDSPFQSVVAQAGLNARQSSLFRLLITMTHSDKQGENVLNTQDFENLSDISPKGELGLVIEELPDTFRFSISFAEPLYSPERMKRFAGHFETLLTETITGNTEIGIGRLKMMTDAERTKILYNFSTPIVKESPYRAEHSLLEIFEAQVQRFPDKPALFSEEDGAVTYKELNDSSTKLYKKLVRKFRDSRNDFVSILLPAGKYAVASIIAIHKLGGTCVPINIRFPIDQIKSMLADVGNPMLLTTRKDLANLKDLCTLASAFFVEEDLAEPDDDANTAERVPNRIPYGLFTSGSTGRPKLVLVTETSIMNMAYWMQFEFQLTDTEKALQFYSPATDGFLGAFWPNIASGGTIYVPPDEMRYDINALWKWVRDKEITFVGLPTTSAETFYSIRAAGSGQNLIRNLLCGGELLKIYPPPDLPYTVVNCYGLTETGVISTFARVTLRDAVTENRAIIIGKPIRNTSIYILDEDMEPVPLGISGELFIGGDGIAKGYFQNSSLNEQKFIANPFDSSQILFRTGDLGYWLPDGNISLSGRSDNLVKIRSHRIELDEIEVSLLKYPNVKQAAVLVEEDDAGEQCIIAFCVTSREEVKGHKLSYTSLYKFLGDRLPYYALPTSIYVLPSFPLNNSGKIDRKLLPTLKSSSTKLLKSSDAIKNPPETTEEITVAEIWSKILNIPFDTISRNDNFFLLGGNSLLLAQIISEYNTRLSAGTGSDLTVSAVFANPTVEALAKHFEKLRTESSTLGMSTNFDQEIILDVDIDSNLKCDKSPPSAILLTGGTGYLGAGLLVELLERTDSIIYCLIRSVHKFEDSIAPYGLDKIVLTQRVIPIIGDLARPNFGLEIDEYSKLAVNVGTIYHCAAEVHFLKTYEELRSTNVGGTVEIIKFATKSCLKILHYISTLGVFSSKLVDSNNNIDVLEEISLDEINIDPRSFTSGYGTSKWVAEKLVWAAIAKGLPGIVYRLGEIGCHGKIDLYNRSDMISMILGSCRELGYLPQINGIIPYGSLDFCASAIVRISLGEKLISSGINLNQVFHIVDYTFTFQELFQAFSSHKEIPIIPLPDWEIKLKEFLHNPPINGSGAIVKGPSAFLSLLFTKKEFKLLNVALTPEVKFLRANISLGELLERESVIKDEGIQRYIRLIAGS